MAKTVKLWVWYAADSYYVTKNKPTKGPKQPKCGLPSCTTCPVAISYDTDSPVVSLCSEDFHTILGKGLKRGLNQIAVKKL